MDRGVTDHWGNGRYSPTELSHGHGPQPWRRGSSGLLYEDSAHTKGTGSEAAVPAHAREATATSAKKLLKWDAEDMDANRGCGDPHASSPQTIRSRWPINRHCPPPDTDGATDAGRRRGMANHPREKSSCTTACLKPTDCAHESAAHQASSAGKALKVTPHRVLLSPQE